MDAILTAIEKAQAKVNIFNLGMDDYCAVNDSVGWITEHLGVAPAANLQGGDRGWIGDNPFIFLDTRKIRAWGWKPRSSRFAREYSHARLLRANPRVLRART